MIARPIWGLLCRVQMWSLWIRAGQSWDCPDPRCACIACTVYIDCPSGTTSTDTRIHSSPDLCWPVPTRWLEAVCLPCCYCIATYFRGGLLKKTITKTKFMKNSTLCNFRTRWYCSGLFPWNLCMHTACAQNNTDGSLAVCQYGDLEVLQAVACLKWETCRFHTPPCHHWCLWVP